MNYKVVDVAFRVAGDSVLPAAHAYPLYAALKRELPWLQETEGVGVFPLRGDYLNGRIRTGPRTSLRLRTPIDLLPQFLVLTGRSLQIADGRVQLGVPRVLPLRPAASLQSRLVQIKLANTINGITAEAFLESANKQLSDLNIKVKASIPTITRGPRAGQPIRGVLRIKGERHVGFSLLVEGLTADESLRLQQEGLGGRRKMGCGLFVPVRGGA